MIGQSYLVIIASNVTKSGSQNDTFGEYFTLIYN